MPDPKRAPHKASEIQKRVSTAPCRDTELGLAPTYGTTLPEGLTLVTEGQTHLPSWVIVQNPSLPPFGKGKPRLRWEGKKTGHRMSLGWGGEVSRGESRLPPGALRNESLWVGLTRGLTLFFSCGPLHMDTRICVRN